MRHDVGDHPAASQVLEAVHRSFTKPTKRGFNAALLRSISYKEFRTPTGIHLGRAAAYDVDLERLCAVIRRTTLGMFATTFGQRLPADYTCCVYAIDGFSSMDLATSSNLQVLVSAAVAGQVQVWGEKVFTSWFQRVDGRPYATLWAHLVCSRVAFLALTMPLEDAGDAA
jgi:hypothetical protein